MNINKYFSIVILSVIVLMLSSACNNNSKTKEAQRFQLLTAAETGVNFANQLTETPDMNIFNYMYFFNGAGVATGDVNGDDLPDIYFTSNQSTNKLYLNKGNFQFEDITDIAKIAGDAGWKTGVTMADVNGDGLLDIYVSQLGKHLKFQGKNQLYINLGVNDQGIPTFENQAEQWGLDLVGYATQATFFDYDLDGDLDMFMLNHSVHQNGTFGRKTQFVGTSHPLAGDKLLRNDGNYFTDVTEKSGINSSVIGYGLGVTASDINLDGYPDLYVGNDFHEDDYLYINNGNGTFSDVLNESMAHTSRFSMGNDIGDINNDGFPDIVSLDMLPEDPIILKASAAEEPYDVYQFKLNYGYNNQLARNTLQLNYGFLPEQPKGVRFGDIALLAGIAATDWSWSALMADLDNDGWNDIFISNGVLGRSNDLDYINFVIQDSIQMKLHGESISERSLKLTELMPKIKLPNYAYRNKGDLTFENMSATWGFNQKTYSHGTAYADFDNDGDLDLVINNINDPASIYKNLTNNTTFKDNNYLSIELEGKAPNTFGLGAKIIARTPQGRLLKEVTATRGFQSAVDTRIHIGLGKATSLEELTIVWSDGTFQTLKNITSNQILKIKQSEAAGKFDYLVLKRPSDKPTIFQDVSKTIAPDYTHQENLFVEFNREPLMPYMISAEGPKIAVGDVNGDKLEDFYVCGAKWQPGALFSQRQNGFFQQLIHPVFVQDSLYEDTDAVFFDADSDSDLDLLVASGGNEFGVGAPENRPRLYLNDGKGQFSRPQGLLPDISLTASAVLAFDFDNDKDLDVFIGGRAVPWHYGEIPQSYLLENDGTGHFKNVTATKAKGLVNVGFVKNAALADINKDGKQDLLLACEWSPIQIFLGKNNSLEKLALKGSGLENYIGWWNNIIPADFDGDGDIDMIAGNLGFNSKLKASDKEPVVMYYTDIDGNGTNEQLLCHYNQGKQRLFATRDEITKQIVSVKKKYLKYTDYAKADLYDIFDKSKLHESTKYVANHFASSYIENLGDSKFKIHLLPIEAQFSNINAGIVQDFDEDGILDVLLAGNSYEINVQLGRYDASGGLLLKGVGKGEFRALNIGESGVNISGQTRDLKALKAVGNRTFIIAARNKEKLQFLEWNQAATASISLTSNKK